MSGLTRKHETPEEWDELFEREEVTEEDYYQAFGLRGRQKQIDFWVNWWNVFAEEEATPKRRPAKREPLPQGWSAVWKTTSRLT